MNAGGIVEIEVEPSGGVDAVAERVESVLAAVDGATEPVVGVVVHVGSGGPRGDVPVDDAASATARLSRATAALRRLESLEVPVVAIAEADLTGDALEVALAAHHRIVPPDTLIGTGGGMTRLGATPRLVRMLGLLPAIDTMLLADAPLDADAAQRLGLVDVAERGASAARARAWIDAHPGMRQPWDARGFRIPGGGADATSLPVRIARLHAASPDDPRPVARAALAAAVEGSHVGFEAASAIETRYAVNVALRRSTVSEGKCRNGA